MATVMKTLRFPEEIIEEMKPIIKKHHINFTDFVMSAIESYISSIQFTNNVNSTFGAWKNNEHKELDSGTEKYIRKMRKGRSI
jgi:uncharacterized protein YfbU (UPF0304 family)